MRILVLIGLGVLTIAACAEPGDEPFVSNETGDSSRNEETGEDSPAEPERAVDGGEGSTDPESDGENPGEGSTDAQSDGENPGEGSESDGAVVDATAGPDAGGETDSDGSVSGKEDVEEEGPSDSGEGDGTTGAEDAGETVISLEGTEPNSCGMASEGFENVDCTVFGDADAVCVYGHHCMCSEGFICETVYPDLEPDSKECDNGSHCIPDPNFIPGSTAKSCGDPVNQNLVPVDCTAGGDLQSFCVYSNHCACSEGYQCDGEVLFESESPETLSECAPGVICIPASE